MDLARRETRTLNLHVPPLPTQAPISTVASDPLLCDPTNPTIPFTRNMNVEDLAVNDPDSIPVQANQVTHYLDGMFTIK